MHAACVPQRSTCHACNPHALLARVYRACCADGPVCVLPKPAGLYGHWVATPTCKALCHTSLHAAAACCCHQLLLACISGGVHRCSIARFSVRLLPYLLLSPYKTVCDARQTPHEGSVHVATGLRRGSFIHACDMCSAAHYLPCHATLMHCWQGCTERAVLTGPSVFCQSQLHSRTLGNGAHLYCPRPRLLACRWPLPWAALGLQIKRVQRCSTVMSVHPLLSHSSCCACVLHDFGLTCLLSKQLSTALAVLYNRMPCRP